MDDRLRLILLSFLMLFVELALIRWTGSNVYYLAYFSNFVLLGSFLGIGVGFLRASSRFVLFRFAPFALLGFVAFIRVFKVEVDRRGSDLIYFGQDPTGSSLPAWVILPIIFVAVACIMAMIADGVARTFARFAPLEAYRLDILGSVLGIVAFSALSFLRASPLAWGVIVALLFLLLLGRAVHLSNLLALAALTGLVAILRFESQVPTDSWSPYYKISLRGGGDSYEVAVNGIPHQAIEPVERRLQEEPFYGLPYQRARGIPLDDVLIVGAGTGTDTAVALAAGARHVDAVEIDPRLYEIGAELHPNKPYSDPRVTAHIEDARAFLQRTDRRYDLILFALPDSLTLVAGQSSLRLESYLFTREALEQARNHLKPGGVFSMYNYYREDWLVNRLAGELNQVYGHPPCLDGQGGWGRLALLTNAPDSSLLSCPTVWDPATPDTPPPVSDDRPFIYLKERLIPRYYLFALGLILVVSVGFVRLAGGPLRPMTGYLDLFFMGAAFLLLETKNVVQFALLFGSTWFVNALVFAGILLTVLAAVEVSRRIQSPRPTLLYGVLLGALVVAWIVPASALLQLEPVPRLIAATLLAFAPVFLANLVFAARFKAVGSSTVAFGANLLGAMVGGVLEYASLILGFRSLLLVVAILYWMAFLFGRERLTEAWAQKAAPVLDAP